MVRYIHSGDQVEAEQKQQGKPAGQTAPPQAGKPPRHDSAGGRQDAEAAAEPGEVTRPIAGGQESPSGLDAEAAAEPGEATRPVAGGQESPSGLDAEAAAEPGEETRPVAGGQESPPGQDAEAAAEPGEETRPVAGGQENPPGLDAGEGSAAAADSGAGEDGAARGEESGAVEATDESSPGGGVFGFLSSLFGDEPEPGQGNEADAGSAGGQNQQMEAADELGQPNQDQKQDGRNNVDIGVDSGATGYGDHDLQASDGAGTPDQEGTAKADQDSPDSGPDTALPGASSADQGTQGFTAGNSENGGQLSSGSNKESAPAAGAQSSADEAPGDQDQDTETSDELGAEPPAAAHKGFFARLFGDDEETEDESEEDSYSNTSGRSGGQRAAVGQAQSKAQGDGGQESPEQSGEKTGKAAKKAKAEPQAEAAEKPKDPLQQKRDNERSDSLEQSILYWQGNDKISPELEATKKTLTEVMGLGSSFDIVFREMSFGGRRTALLCISGFAKDTIIDEILKRLTYLTPENISADVFSSFMSEYIPHVQVEKGELLSESINKVLSGMSVFFFEGETQVIVMDTRAYPARSPDEPSIERVVRGARDGFTETLLSNVALVRRRVRDPGLKFEMHQIGRRTRTDVSLAYIDDIVDKTQVQAVTDKLKSVDIDGIPLADKQLEEAIVGGGWNPYPLVRYSERPDIVASHLLEGRVVIFVDTSPSVMVLPTTFFDLCQHAEENRQTPFMGSYLRWVRFIGIFASMFLLPLWMLLVIHPELKPAVLEFIGPQKTAKIPLIAQFLIVELGVDLLRMAAVHTPTPLGSAMGLIAAILVGDIAVQTGLFVNEVVLYMAVASIGMFATPSYELGLANRIVRLVLLLAVAAFQVPGFMIGTTLLVVLLTTHRSYNSSYLWPFIPFNAKAMGEIILRQPVLSSKTRPSFNKTRDNTRMPPVQKNERKS